MIKQMTASSMLRLALLVTMALLLTACGKSDQELENYIQSVLAEPGPPIEPLPELEEFESFEYVVRNRRDPFSNPVTAIAAVTAAATGPRPDQNRRKELLESFPLDSLSMVGTLNKGAKLTALIMDPSSVVHKIRPGNYLGQNDGKVVGVFEDRIQIRELIPDGGGAWMERDAEVSIEDTEFD